jgi:hypothetical protein
VRLPRSGPAAMTLLTAADMPMRPAAAGRISGGGIRMGRYTAALILGAVPVTPVSVTGGAVTGVVLAGLPLAVPGDKAVDADPAGGPHTWSG